jgi:hypothetical protein
LNAPPISADQKNCGTIYFARMLDKIGKHAKGELRPDFHENLGGGFDAMMTDYLRIDYATLRERFLQEGNDKEMLISPNVISHAPAGPKAIPKAS